MTAQPIIPGFSRTKIPATRGSATRDVATNRQLVATGIDAVGLNMSYGDTIFAAGTPLPALVEA